MKRSRRKKPRAKKGACARVERVSPFGRQALFAPKAHRSLRSLKPLAPPKIKSSLTAPKLDVRCAAARSQALLPFNLRCQGLPESPQTPRQKNRRVICGLSAYCPLTSRPDMRFLLRATRRVTGMRAFAPRRSFHYRISGACVLSCWCSARGSEDEKTALFPVNTHAS